MRICLFCMALLLAVPMSGQLLFPGDMNNDGTADHLDLLPLGVAYGATGPPRFDPSIDWLPMEAEPWPQSLPVSGWNYSFVDSNGDGTIDSLDIDAIPFNYDSLQNISYPPPEAYILDDTVFVTDLPQLILEFDQDSAMQGATVVLTVRYEYPAISAAALALAFKLEYDEFFVKDSSTVFVPDAGAGDLMFVSATTNTALGIRSPEVGSIEFAASGRGLPALTSSRILGRYEIIIEDMIFGLGQSDTMVVDVKQPLLIDLEERVIAIEVIGDTLILVDTLMNNPAIALHGLTAEAVQLFPNPGSAQVELLLPKASALHLIIWDQMGRKRRNLKLDPARSHLIQTAFLEPGLYFFELKTAYGQTLKKVLIE